LAVASRSLDTGSVVSYPTGSPIGSALESAGDELQAVAVRFQAKQEEMDKFKRITLENEYDQAVQNQSEEFARNAPADGSGIHDGIVGQIDPTTGQVAKPGLFDNLAQQFRDRVPASQREHFDANLGAKRLKMSGNAAAVQSSQEQEYAKVETAKIQDGLLNSILQMDPDDSASYEEYKAKGREAIEASPMKPLLKQVALDKWDQTAPKALAQAIMTRDPGKLRSMLGMAPSEAATTGGTAIDTVVNKIIGVESGGNASAKNPKSSAAGLGQFIDSTWLATIKKHRPDIAAGKSAAQIIALKTDPALAREMTKAFTQDNAEYLTNRGVATTPGNIYLAHFLGAGGAVRVLKADPGASIGSIVGQDAITANPFLAGKSVADTIAWSNKKMGGASGVASAPVDPRLAGLSPEDRWSLANQADSAAAGQRVEMRTGIEVATTNAPAAIQNTGTYSGNIPGREQFVAAYGEGEGGQRFDQFQASIDTSRQAFDMKTMPESTIQEMVKKAQPTSTGETAALDQKRYEVISNAAAATLKAREADPASYVRQVFPSVNEQWNNAQSQGNYQSAVAASIAAQQQLGIRNVQPLPKEFAASAVESFKNESKPQESRIAEVSAILMATPDPEQRKALFNQMVDAGLPDATEGAFEALSRGDEGAANRLFQAAMVDPAKLAGTLPNGIKPANIDEAVQGAIMEDGQIGDIYYGLSDGTAENFTRAQRDSKLINNSVNLRLRNGETLDQAIEGVSKDLYGDVQAVDTTNAKILVPKDQDAGEVVDGLRALMPEVRTALATALAVPTEAKAADGTRAILDATTKAHAENIMSEGYFRNSGDGYVFIDPYVGAAIAGPDGKPLIFNIPEAGLVEPQDDRSKPLTDQDFDEFQRRMGTPQ
jgi:hypothetical protein